VASSHTFTVTPTGSDPTGASSAPPSGIASYDVYLALDGGAFGSTPYATVPAGGALSFQGQDNHTYAFYSRGHDVAGNTESKTPVVEASIYVPDLTPPVTQVASVDHTTPN